MRLRFLLLLLTVAASAALHAQGPAQPLFNGKDLTGWTMVGPGRFVVNGDGTLVTEGGMGLLWYNARKIGNETLRVVFKTTGPTDNSGVYIRLPEPPPDPWYGVHNGYEVQIDGSGDEWHMTGAIYSLSRATKKAQKAAGEWNTMEIQFDGPVTRVTLNGEMVNEFKGGSDVPARKQWYEPVRGPRPDVGYIGLQNHDPRSKVTFKEVSVIPTGKSPIVTPQGDRDQLLSYLHATRKQVLDATEGLSAAQWNFKPAQDKWSVAEVVEHITRTEPFLFGFFTNFINHSAPAPADLKLTRDQLVANMTDRSKPAQAPAEIRPTGQWQAGPELVGEFKSRRDNLITWLIGTKEPLTRTWASWFGQTVSVYQGLWTLPAHTERHLTQILEVKANPNFPKK